MISNLKHSRTKTFLFFICTLITTNTLISMQEEQLKRSLTVQNNLFSPVSITLYYFNQMNKKIRKEKYYLDPQQTAETILLPLDKTIEYMIKTIHGKHKQKTFGYTLTNIIKLGENEITIQNANLLNPPSIAIIHRNESGSHVSWYDKK